jgi:hypothetical protein
MAEPHVVSALRAKRAEISGHVHDLERKLARHRARYELVNSKISDMIALRCDRRAYVHNL